MVTRSKKLVLAKDVKVLSEEDVKHFKRDFHGKEFEEIEPMPSGGRRFAMYTPVRNGQQTGKNILLEGPEPVDVRHVKDEEIGFSWSNQFKKYRLGVSKGKPYFMIQWYGEVPKEYQGAFTEKEIDVESKYHVVEDGQTRERTAVGKEKVHVLTYGDVPERDKKDFGSKIPRDYYISKPRDFSLLSSPGTDGRPKKLNPKNPETLSVNELVALMRGKKVLF
ncbi:MAG: hypothetical protein GF334_10480, partial [Candidatus Altiarchaeales archaeon]|nr:hypothetical protein [Candidatus Altiarchaeales archaeon]